jgi:hypothetical protein
MRRSNWDMKWIEAGRGPSWPNFRCNGRGARAGGELDMKDLLAPPRH